MWEENTVNTVSKNFHLLSKFFLNTYIENFRIARKSTIVDSKEDLSSLDIELDILCLNVTLSF